MSAKRLDRMETESTIGRPWVADRITVRRNFEPFASFFRPWWCSYESGPGLFELADVCGQLFGPGVYGLASRRALGFRAKPPRLTGCYTIYYDEDGAPAYHAGTIPNPSACSVVASGLSFDEVEQWLDDEERESCAPHHSHDPRNRPFAEYR